MQNPDAPHVEPEEVFLPLSTARYAEFYALEMNNFSKDILFYQNNIPAASTILELGCGTGRISDRLSETAHMVTGLDLSQDMLRQASRNSNTAVHYVCMDMCRMAFTQKFDSVIIPYNTSNLLKSESKVICCFKQVHELLRTDGTFLFQIYIPDTNMFKHEGEKLFQFQMFSLPDNKGKLIKETTRTFSGPTNTIQLEERYRVRGKHPTPVKEDYSHTIQLTAFSFEKWISILNNANFQIISLSGDYDSRPFRKGNDTLLLIKARKN